MKKITLYASSIGFSLLAITVLRTLIISKIGCAIPTVLSGLSCAVPLGGALPAFGLLAAGKFFSVTHCSLLAYHIPSIIAAAYWHNRIKYLEYAIPLLSAVLFLSHPTGSQAWGYPLFWLIPPIASFIFPIAIARPLTASFIAHAVGSVLWLYTVSSAAIPAYWWGLMLVVPFERSAVALGMALVGYAQDYVLLYTRSMSFFSYLRAQPK